MLGPQHHFEEDCREVKIVFQVGISGFYFLLHDRHLVAQGIGGAMIRHRVCLVRTFQQVSLLKPLAHVLDGVAGGVEEPDDVLGVVEHLLPGFVVDLHLHSPLHGVLDLGEAQEVDSDEEVEEVGQADEDEVRTLRGVPALDDLHEVEHNLPRDEVRHRDRVLRVVC